MSTVSLEEVDLSSLVEALRAELGGRLEAGYLDGRTILRDAVAARLGCSDYEAEQLVETLELQHLIRFPILADETHPAGGQWHIGR